MRRAMCSLVLVLIVTSSTASFAIGILPGELENFTSPCTLSLSQNGSVRTLSWSSVTGASTYKVGYRIGGSIVTLAEVSGTNYEHTGWNASDCLEYVLVASDGSGAKVCAAHLPNVGSNCPE